MDGSITKAPLGGEGTGPNPTDRAKSGAKRSILVEGNGIPLAVAVAGANRHDMKMAETTLENIVIDRPKPTKEHPQNMCMDKGYDLRWTSSSQSGGTRTAHIVRRGVDQSKRKRVPGYRARRWVVERTNSWMNRFRRLLTRWEKKIENYVAMLDPACAWITYQQAGIFG